MIKIDLSASENHVVHTLLTGMDKMQFRRNEIVVREGTVCRYLFWIEKGMLRNFYFDKNGNDITHWFASEHMFITIPPSFFKKESSFFGMEALEDTVVRVISLDQFETLLKESIELERFCRLLVTETMITLGKKIIDLQTQSAEYRYDRLLEMHPDIFQRAKLGHISGYLGIKQQSLSRIRAQKKNA